jgi:hypothetical protein
MRLVALFMVFVVAVGAFGQSCERTLPVTIGLPGMSLPGLEAKDFDATLNREHIQVVKVEPIRQSRVLILIAADYLSRIRDKKDFQRTLARLSAIDPIPENVSIAYGMYAKTIAFSDHFTSDARELRASLDTLASKAESGVLGKEWDYNNCLLGPALDFLGAPQSGDTLVYMGGWVSYCAPGHEKYKKDDRMINHLAETRYFLENGIRSFSVSSYCADWGPSSYYSCEAGLHKNSFGGYGAYLSSSKASKKDEEANWQAVKGYFLTRGDLVTLAVPEKARDGEIWHLSIGANYLSRLGFPPVNKGLLMTYPSLLLCTSDKNGDPNIGQADLNFPY